MKLIRILVLVAAMAAFAMAQNTGSTGPGTGSGAQPSGTASQNQKSSTTAPAKTKATVKGSPKGGSNAQTPAVKVVVTKGGAQTGAKNSASTNSKAAAQPSPKTPLAQKPSVSGPAGTKSGSTQKTPVVTVKPLQKPPTNAKSASVAAVSKKKTRAVTAQKNQVKVVPQKTADKKVSPVSEARNITAGNRRDPFVSIIRNMPVTAAGPTCSTGKRCLYIPDLELKGIAKDTEGQMLAVVVSNTHRAYFLRENDQVFNGSVQKITNDSVVFREFATDHLGRETAHEVVKKIPKS